MRVNTNVRLFNPRDFTLTIGSAIFTFEGIGLILPIQSSMKEPQKFEKMLFTVVFIITIVYLSVGALSYAALGDKMTVEIINNFPQDSKLVNAVQFLYSLAVLVGDPVQLFPAMRIIEGALFGHRPGKKDLKTKWKRNAFRAGIVCLCGIISVSSRSRQICCLDCIVCMCAVGVYLPAISALERCCRKQVFEAWGYRTDVSRIGSDGLYYRCYYCEMVRIVGS